MSGSCLRKTISWRALTSEGVPAVGVGRAALKVCVPNYILPVASRDCAVTVSSIVCAVDIRIAIKLTKHKPSMDVIDSIQLNLAHSSPPEV